MSKLVQLLSAAMALTWLVQQPVRAADKAACETGQEQVKEARLFERSVEPGNDRAPRLMRATSELAMKALAAPSRMAEWIKSRSSGAHPQ